MMRLQFDENQSHQLEAVSSITKIFNGFPKMEDHFFQLGEEIIPNMPPSGSLNEEWMLGNLTKIQKSNSLMNADSPISSNDFLEMDEGPVLEGTGNNSVKVPHFTIEMETGTGKTYTYFRTIYELRKKYGFIKFVIVVPSIAIYQGVIKTYQITKDHFATLYNNEPVQFIEYDGSQISRIRDYSTNFNLTIMLMTIDSFNKTGNVFYKSTENLQGELRPFEWVQQTRPIIILDEPQNMNTEKAKASIRTLNPLFVIRYSATHRITPNLVYRLTPLDAFRQNLVKTIEVVGVAQLSNLNVPMLRLKNIFRNPIRAKIGAYKVHDGEVSEQEFELKQGDDLFQKTHHEDYQGYVVSEITIDSLNEDGYILFENGMKISYHDEVIGAREDVFRAQIQKTIEIHLERQMELRPLGVKVLSLFFIDRVRNYTFPDGIIKRLFDEEFDKLKVRYPDFMNFEPNQVREGYFAKPKPDAKEEEAIDTNSSTKEHREMEKTAFELIMKKKEQLLSFDEPVSFIFAHSALKEGWDNPNVFQICTLNQTYSNIKKRQEIGRGLRLSVDQSGNRVQKTDVNILSVIANESYESYVSNLQREYINDGDIAPPQPKKPEQGYAKRRDHLYNREDFRDFWNKLNRKLDYRIHVETEKLIDECVERLNRASFPDSVIVLSQGTFIITDYTISLITANESLAEIHLRKRDTFGYQLEETVPCKANTDLGRERNDPGLRGFKVTSIEKNYVDWVVKFGNGEVLTPNQPIHFQTTRNDAGTTIQRVASETNYPVFDVIERVASETNLTKSTVLRIFNSMEEKRKGKIFKNPEGWSAVFLTEIKNALCDHIAENIIFVPYENEETYNIDDIFPAMRKHPQRELMDAGDTGLYDKVQIDSDVESYFVSGSLGADREHMLIYFKFPPLFKVHLPKIIGNYNPDWGIIRRSNDGTFTLQLVRETKGNDQIDDLQFAHEKRKIICAKKAFAALGISYRVVTDKTPNWWED